MSKPVSYRIYEDLKNCGEKLEVKTEIEGAIRFGTFLLHSEEGAYPASFEPNVKLEAQLKYGDCRIVEDKSAVSVYPDITVYPKAHYQEPAHYYHDALRQYCAHQVKMDADPTLCKLRDKYIETTGELPTVASLNKEIISGLKHNTSRLDIDVLQTLLIQEYKDTIRAEVSAAAMLNIHGYKMDRLSLQVAACTVLKAERALERQGVTLQNYHEIHNIFAKSDETIARLSKDEKHPIAEMAAKFVRPEKEYSNDGREVQL